jgi:hypothetical protein
MRTFTTFTTFRATWPIRSGLDLTYWGWHMGLSTFLRVTISPRNISSRTISPYHISLCHMWLEEIWLGKMCLGKMWFGEMWLGEIWLGEMWFREMWLGVRWNVTRENVTRETVFSGKLCIRRNGLRRYCPRGNGIRGNHPRGNEKTVNRTISDIFCFFLLWTLQIWWAFIVYSTQKFDPIYASKSTKWF